MHLQHYGSTSVPACPALPRNNNNVRRWSLLKHSIMLAVVCNANTLCVWDAYTRENIASIDPVCPEEPIQRDSAAPDKKRRKVDLAATNVCLSSSNFRLALSAGGSHASDIKHAYLNVWDVASSKLLGCGTYSKIKALSMTASGDRVVVTGRASDEYKIDVYEVTDEAIRKIFVSECPGVPYTNLSFNMGDTMFTCGLEGENFDDLDICVWSSSTGELLRRIPNKIQGKPGHRVASKSSSYVLCCDGSENICVTAFGLILESWNLVNGEVAGPEIRTLAYSHHKQVESLCFGENDEIIIASVVRRICIYNRITGAKLKKFNFDIRSSIGYLPAVGNMVYIQDDYASDTDRYTTAMIVFQEVPVSTTASTSYEVVHFVPLTREFEFCHSSDLYWTRRTLAPTAILL